MLEAHLRRTLTTHVGRSTLSDATTALTDDPDELFVLGSTQPLGKTIYWERFSTWKAPGQLQAKERFENVSSRIASFPIFLVPDSNELRFLTTTNTTEDALGHAAIGATKVAPSFSFGCSVHGVACSANGAFLVYDCSPREIRVCDPNTGTIHWRTKDPTKGSFRLAVSDDGNTVAWSSYHHNPKARGVYVQKKGASKRRKVSEHCAFALLFRRDGNALWCISTDRIEYVPLDGTPPTSIPLAKRRSVFPVAVSDDGSVLLSGAFVQAVAPTGTISVTERVWERVHPCVSPDGTRVSYLDNNVPVLVSLRTGKEQQWSDHHTGTISSIAVASSGNRAATSSYDGTIRVWDLDTYTPRAMFETQTYLHDLHWSNDGNMLFARTERTLRCWSLSTLEEETPTPAPSIEGIELRVSPDGVFAITTRGLIADPHGVFSLVNLTTMQNVSIDQNQIFQRNVLREIDDDENFMFGYIANFENEGRQIRLWINNEKPTNCALVDSTTGTLLRHEKAALMEANEDLLTVSSDQSCVLVGGEYHSYGEDSSRNYRLLSLKDRSCLASFRSSPIYDLDYNGECIAIACSELVLLNGEKKLQITLPNDCKAFSVAWLPAQTDQHRLLLVGCSNGQLFLFECTYTTE